MPQCALGHTILRLDSTQSRVRIPMINAVMPFQCVTERGHPYMTSVLRGEGGVSPKEDVVREVEVA